MCDHLVIVTCDITLIPNLNYEIKIRKKKQQLSLLFSILIQYLTYYEYRYYTLAVIISIMDKNKNNKVYLMIFYFQTFISTKLNYNTYNSWLF